MKWAQSLREQSAGLMALVAWGCVAIAWYYSPRENTPEVRPVLDHVDLARSFELAAERNRDHTVEFVEVSGDSNSQTSATQNNVPSGSPDGAAIRPIGCGVVLTTNGLVLSTKSVLKDSSNIRVRLKTGQLLNLTTIERDASSPLAVAQIENWTGSAAALLGYGSQLRPGAWVVGLCPFEQDLAVKPGVIRESRSAKAGMLETEAARHPWREGAPLVDLRGSVVGLMFRPQQDDAVGTAIQVDASSPWLMNRVIKALDRPAKLLGLVIEPVTVEAAQRCKLGHHAGALVSSVVPDSPGTEAGIQAGDVVVGLGTHRVASTDDLHHVLHADVRTGRRPIEIVRDGWRMTLHVRLPDDGLGDTDDNNDEVDSP